MKLRQDPYISPEAIDLDATTRGDNMSRLRGWFRQLLEPGCRDLFRNYDPGNYLFSIPWIRPAKISIVNGLTIISIPVCKKFLLAAFSA